MKNILKYLSLSLCASLVVTFIACDDDDDNAPAPMVMYEQEDHMARPAINTVFVSTGEKDMFNTTTPSAQGPAFATKFKDKLLALNPRVHNESPWTGCGNFYKRTCNGCADRITYRSDDVL